MEEQSDSGSRVVDGEGLEGRGLGGLQPFLLLPQSAQVVGYLHQWRRRNTRPRPAGRSRASSRTSSLVATSAQCRSSMTSTAGPRAASQARCPSVTPRSARWPADAVGDVPQQHHARVADQVLAVGRHGEPVIPFGSPHLASASAAFLI